jgi:hypothetical protein
MANQGLNAGGRVALKVDNIWYHPVADVVIEPTNIEPDSVVNQDGSVQRIVKAKALKATITIRDRRGLDIMRLIEASGGIDATIDEIDMKRRCLFSNAFVQGAASRNTQSGEIDGLEIVSDQFKIVER